MTLDYFVAALQGLPFTLLITVAGFLLGAIVGVPLVIARLSPIPPLRWLAVGYIELLRGIPPIVWIFVLYFGLGASTFALTNTAAAILAFGLISGAYMSEIYRGGLNAVHPGQWEAADSLGMSRVETVSRIVGPQVFRVSVPAAATYAIGLLKDSSIAFTIGVTEIVYYASQQSRDEADAMGPFLAAALIYIAISVPCAFAARRLDGALRVRVAA